MNDKIKIPDGWYKLGTGEKIKNNDKFWGCLSENWIEINPVIVEHVREADIIIRKIN